MGFLLIDLLSNILTELIMDYGHTALLFSIASAQKAPFGIPQSIQYGLTSTLLYVLFIFAES